MALAWCMSASRALRGPLSGSCRPRSPRCAAMERTALQELDSLERGQLPAPSANRRRRLPRFSLRVERESSELSLCGEREGVKKAPRRVGPHVSGSYCTCSYCTCSNCTGSPSAKGGGGGRSRAGEACGDGKADG